MFCFHSIYHPSTPLYSIYISKSSFPNLIHNMPFEKFLAVFEALLFDSSSRRNTERTEDI
uniref:Uncharacterized protein n=1 Tax=Meloidogyne incognita TaxID=6306 RepID=A0A914L521_MELIC